MAFPESVKARVRRMAHVQCCICEGPFGVDVHHIVPETEGGSDDIDNAAPLCPTCHRTYGSNSEARKQLRERRDVWYEICRRREGPDALALGLANITLVDVGQSIRADVADLRTQTVARLQELDQKLSVLMKSPSTKPDVPSQGAPSVEGKLAITLGSALAFGSFLQKPVGSVDLLLCLQQSGKAAVTAILSETGMSRDMFYNAKERLMSLGFAYEDRQSGPPTQVFIGLTRAGEAIARALVPVTMLLAETVPALEHQLHDLESADDPATAPRRLELYALLFERTLASKPSLAEGCALGWIAFARQVGDARSGATAHLALARLRQRQDRHEDAERELGEASDTARRLGLLGIVAEVEYLRGARAERLGKWQEAQNQYAVSEALAVKVKDHLVATRARYAVARILSRQGRLEESLALLQEVAASLERLGAEDDLPRAYASLGSAAYLANRPEALEWFGKAIATAQRVGDLRTEAYCLANSAAQLIDLRHFRKADDYLRRARGIFEALEEKTGLGATELNLANLCVAQDRWTEAVGHFASARDIARETSNRFQEASVLFNQGQMMKRQGRLGEARAAVADAKTIFQLLGASARATRCEDELRDIGDQGLQSQEFPAD